MALALAVAVVKPWGAAEPPSEPGSSGPGGSPASRPSPGAVASPQSDPAVVADGSWQCEYASDWRVFVLGAGVALPTRATAGPESSEVPYGASASPSTAPSTPTAGGRLEPTRAWLAIAPLADASGPEDPQIPVIRVIVESPPAIGYCAPTSGPDAPPAGIAVTAWRIGAAGTATEVATSPVELPGQPDDGSEGLYAPTATPVTAWPDGRTVFRLSGPGDYARWFGVDIGSIGGGAPSPLPSPLP